MSDGKEHVKKLAALAAQMDKPGENFETNFGRIAVEFAALIVTATAALDKTQKRVMWLTVFVAVLTAALVALPFIEHALK